MKKIIAAGLLAECKHLVADALEEVESDIATTECLEALESKGAALAHKLAIGCMGCEGRPSNAADVKDQGDGHGTASVVMVQAELAAGLPQISVM